MVLKHEGGYVNDPADAGGETKFGISKRSHPAVDIKALTVEDAKHIYLDDYWTPYKFRLISSQAVANKVFDLAVLCGPVPAVRMLQQALKYLGAATIVADGKIGSLTIAAIDNVDEGKLLRELIARAAHFHAGLGQPHFLLGWLRRDLDV